MRIEVLSSPAEFAAVRAQWNRLAGAVSKPSPFQTNEWLLARWSGLGLDGHVLVGSEGAEFRAALALAVGRGRPRVASFLAGDYAGLDLMLHGEEPDASAHVLIEQLSRLPLDFAELYGFADDSVLARVLPSGQAPIRIDGAPSMRMPDGWERAYAEQASAKTRAGARRKLKRLGEQGELKFVVAREPDEVVAAIDDSFRLHELRWAARPDPDRSEYSRQREFHRGAGRSMAESGFAKVALLELDSEAIAFLYYFTFAGTMSVHRLAFDPRFDSFSPGLLVTLQAIEEAAAEGMTRVAFLRGEERYKLQLAHRIEDLLWVAAFPQGASARFVCWYRNTRVRLRQRAKSSTRLRDAHRTVLSRRLGGGGAQA